MTYSPAMQLSDAFALAARQIALGQHFLLAAHAHLDGDALGSMLVTAHGLRLLGKDVFLYSPFPVPRRLRFLPGVEWVKRHVPSSLRFSATLVHDCSARSLLGDAFPSPEVTGPLIVLDHHEIVSDFGDIVVRDSSAGSVGVVSLGVLSSSGLTESALPYELALALFVSLVEDTGWFRYSSANAEVFRLAQLAVSRGVDPWQVSLKLDEQLSEASLRLRTLVLPTLERHLDGRLALLTLTDEHLRAAHATPDDVGQLVQYARALAGVEIGAQITQSDARIYVSLRGKGCVHVGLIAQTFGGGGHRNAAGCTIPLPENTDPQTAVQTAKARLIAACAPPLSALPPTNPPPNKNP